VHYVIELGTDTGWVPQTITARYSEEKVRREMEAWQREDPEAKLRLVRVTTTEEREVVG
jgi:hypothetical protein